MNLNALRAKLMEYWAPHRVELYCEICDRAYLDTDELGAGVDVKKLTELLFERMHEHRSQFNHNDFNVAITEEPPTSKAEMDIEVTVK